MRLRWHVPLVDHYFLRGHHGPSTIVHWKGNKYAISRGTQDYTYYYRDLDDPDTLWVYTGNWRLGYIGIEALNPDADPSPYGDNGELEALYSLFIQDPKDWYYGTDHRGKDIDDLTPPNAIRRLTGEGEVLAY